MGMCADTGRPKNQDRNGKCSTPVTSLPRWHVLLSLVSPSILLTWKNNLGNSGEGVLQTVLTYQFIMGDLNIHNYQGPVVKVVPVWRSLMPWRLTLSYQAFPLVLSSWHSHPVHSPTLAPICVTNRSGWRCLDGKGCSFCCAFFVPLLWGKPVNTNCEDCSATSRGGELGP